MSSLRPRKRFGQHFLRDPLVLHQLHQLLHLQATDTVVEIGPGQAALTRVVLPEVGKLILVEIDNNLIPGLRTLSASWPEKVILLHQDALTLDLATLGFSYPLRVIGNLPYNISTPLLFHFFQQIRLIRDMHFMLQEEVVNRLTAPVGDTAYGRLSVMAQFYCECDSAVRVPPEAFYPPPKVWSGVVRLTPHRTPYAVNPQRFAECVRLAFQARRKTIKNNLRGFANDEVLRAAGIEPHQRAQEIPVAAFVKLCQLVYTMQ